MTDPQYLVSTVWLEQALQRPDIRIIDIRGRIVPASQPPPHYFSHPDHYAEAHIPGAVFVDWISDITVDGPRDMHLAPPEKFAALMSRLGVDDSKLVVAYDDYGGIFASRLWWLLNYYGHDQVVVLDGGWKKWEQEDRPQTAELPQIVPARFTAKVNPAVYSTQDTVNTAAQAGVRLLDVRSPGEFKGEFSRVQRKGHIPGAINNPRKSLLAPDGTVLPLGVLADKFAGLGLAPQDDIITYCNSGVSASFVALALRAAGYDKVRVYDGSWREWAGDDSLPVE